MVGYDISSSLSSSAATGAVSNKNGPNFILGGSNGLSIQTVLIGVALAAGIGFALWKLFTKGK